MSLKYRKKYIAAKIEGTKGTAESLTATEAAILAFDPILDQDIPFDDRMPAGIAMGSLTRIPGEYLGRFRARVELRASGTAGTLPLWASTLLIACGTKNTNVPATSDTISLVSSIADEDTVTIGLWEDGLFKSIKGAMGNAVITADFAKRFFVEFDFVGVWVTPTDVANPAPTHSTAPPRRFAAGTFTFDSYHPKISRFRFDLGNQVEMRPDVENADGSGLAHAYIAERNPTVSCDPETVLVATHDTYGKLIAGTVVDLQLIVGTANNRITLDIPRLQYIDPKSGNRAGLQVHETTMQAVALNGDDEWTLKFD